jgi:hypothetical protein
MGEKWQEIGDDELKSGAEKFRAAMKKEKISNDLIDEIIIQLQETREENNNLIFLFTDKNWAVTAIHVPDEALNGDTGPVLMRGAHPRSIIAAYSQSHIRKKLQEIDDVFEIITGINLHADEADEEWLQELEKMANEVRIKLEQNPPESWEELLA